MIDSKTNEERMKKEIESLKRAKLCIESFKIGKDLGHGSFGVVKEVEHKESKISLKLALKIIPNEMLRRSSKIRVVQTEDQILSRLNHPFIIQFISRFDDKKNAYFLFEKEEGGDLFDELEKRIRFTYEEAKYFASEVILSLRYIHLNDIVYRDLKPENVMLDLQGHTKLIDFGFAKLIENSRTYTLCGTPEYLAPETLRKKREGYGKSVDWWAFGIFLYELLVG